MPPDLSKPYPGISTWDPKLVTRLTVDIPKVDAHLLKSLVIDQTFLTLIAQLAIKQTASYARDNNLSYPADSQRLLDWVRQRTFSRPSDEAAESDDSGGGSSIRSGVTEQTDKPAESGKVTSSGADNGGGGRGTVGPFIERSDVGNIQNVPKEVRTRKARKP